MSKYFGSFNSTNTKNIKERGNNVTKQVFLTKMVVDTFVKEGNLNARQEYIIRTRAKGYTIPKQAMDLCLSVDQVNKEIAKLKLLYDATQKHCSVLPPRAKNKKELFKLDL